LPPAVTWTGACGRDALYVVLARRLDAMLVTADARLARAPDLGVALTLV
jgi:predicted nucleic acid-binding protein